jgi:hypothetical protein
MVPSATDAGQMNRIVTGKWLHQRRDRDDVLAFPGARRQEEKQRRTMKKSGEKASHAKLGPFTYWA